MITQDPLGVGTITKIDAVFGNPALYSTGELIPLGRGRPRIFPIWLLVGMAALNDIYRSDRNCATELSHPLIWQHVRSLAEKHGHALPPRPPSRWWFGKTRDRYLTPDVQARLDEHLLTFGLAAAREAGALNPDAAAYGDGKVFTPRYDTAPTDTRVVLRPDPVTGELVERDVPVRNFDPTAKVHVTGDGRQVHGNKFARIFLRAAFAHGRFPVAGAYVPEEKGQSNSEMDVSMRLLTRVLDRTPEIKRVLYDGAMHGKDRDQLQRNFGVTPIAPIAAKRVNPKTGDRTEKDGYLKTVTFRYGDDDDQEVEIWHVGGWLCQLVITDDGVREYVPLEHAGTERRRNANGTWRTYVLYDVPCPRSTRPAQRIRERTYNNAEDVARGFNRAENILLAPPGSQEYSAYTGRSDAESANYQADEQLHRQRARSLGAARQQFDLWAHNFVQCCVALHLYRERHGPAAVAA